jgi:putative acetyltransferase
VTVVSRTQVAADDPLTADVQELLRRHLEFAHATTPPEGVHALGTDGLLDSAVTFFSLRRDGELIAIGALKELAARHGEVKSMHTAAAARGSGAGRAMLEHIIGVAAERGYERLSLETGSMAAFAPARALYASAGFTLCGPFAAYRPSPTSTFMTLAIPAGAAGPARRSSATGAGPRRTAPSAAQPQQDQPDNGDHGAGAGPEMIAAHRAAAEDAEALQGEYDPADCQQRADEQ